METASCHLCTTTSGVIARGDLWTMALNANQSLLGRSYFALNRHEIDATALTDEEALALMDWFRRARQALDNLLAPDHYNFVMLMNVEPHVHAHIIPRYKGPREYAGAQFVDPDFGGHYDPSREQLLGDDDFARLASQIAWVLPEAGGRS